MSFEVEVRVGWSSVNFKDGLAVRPDGKVARISPLIPGIDLAGEVVASEAADLPVGTVVVAHGYELGVSRHGGYAEYQRVPAGWVVPLAPGLAPRVPRVRGGVRGGGFNRRDGGHQVAGRLWPASRRRAADDGPAGPDVRPPADSPPAGLPGLRSSGVILNHRARAIEHRARRPWSGLWPQPKGRRSTTHPP